MRQKLVQYVQRAGYKPLKPKSLCKKLGVKKRELEQFEAALTEALARGEVRISSSGRIQAGRPAGALIGILRKTAAGDGFVILHHPKPENISGDIFIDREDLRNAQTGDEVLVRLTQRRRAGGQRCGYVEEVLERATNVFVGTYFEEDDAGWVQIDGKDFPLPIWVGDPGAKGAVSGDKVVVEMLRFPAYGKTGEGVLTQVLGPRGEPGVDTQLIIHQFGLPDTFSHEVLEEARLEAEAFNEEDLTGREDLTGWTIVTIDPADARDFDDAISLERSADGNWHLGVHIADVSHFVQPGTALDREAEKRGTSVYLPTRVIPMLPEVISNGLASLQEQRVRYTLSAFLEYTPQGALVDTRLARTAIKVTRRFAYEEVLPLIQQSAPADDSVSPEVLQLLQRMHEFAMLLRKRRFARGSLNLDLPEVRLQLDANQKVIGATQRVHDESHQIIEEFMIAANVAVATKLTDQQLPFLRRVHAEPTEMKMQAFGEFAAILGYPIKRVQSRRDLQLLLDQVRGRPEEQALNYALLRSLKQAEYSPVPIGHYALAEQNYCHFTSPIRRYPDLLVHRLVAGLVTDRSARQGPGMEELMGLGRHCSITERRAEQAERELIKLKLLSYFQDRIGEQLVATITGIEQFGFFARGVEMPAEGLVHISTLSDRDLFDFDRAAQALIGRRSGTVFRLGDRVLVEVVHVDQDRRELSFRYIGRPDNAAASATGPHQSGSQTKRSSSSVPREKPVRSGRKKDRRKPR